MKRLFFAFLLLFVAGHAVASDDVCWVRCPSCECAGGGARDASRNSYAGVRVYANVHAEYEYKLPGNRIKETVDTLGFGTTMGSNLTDWFRIEYEALYLGAQYKANDTNFEYDIWANMLNAYLMWEVADAFAPYVGAGVGLTGIWGEINGKLDNAFDVSYQALAGVWLHITSRIDVEIGFKYAYFGKVNHSTGATYVDAVQAYIGAAYKFGL